jgi:hypothetical protein
MLQSQLNILNNEIAALKPIVMAQGSGADTAGKRIDDLPHHPKATPKVGNFFDVIHSSNVSMSDLNTTSESGASNSQVTSSFLFGSYKGSSSEEYSTFMKSQKDSIVNVSIGFRATKVTIDRGGWFNTEILKSSKNFYRTGSDRFSEIFPYFPVAFIIVKDVTIKVKMDSSVLDTAHKFVREQCSKGGGFLCFSASSSSSKSRESKNAHCGKTSDGLIIRIPGPQIMLWIMERVPDDESDPYDDPKRNRSLVDDVLAMLP